MRLAPPPPGAGFQGVWDEEMENSRDRLQLLLPQTPQGGMWDAAQMLPQGGKGRQLQKNELKNLL